MTKFFNVWLAFTLSLSSLLLPTTSMGQESLFDSSALNLFNQEDEFLRIDEAFKLNFYQDNNIVDVKIDIEDGYYLYRKQFKFSPQNASISPVDLPVGIEHNDEFFGLQQIYTSTLNFTIDLTEVYEDAILTIRYQGCAKKGLCYPPDTVDVSLAKIISSAKNDANNQSIVEALSSSYASNTASSKAGSSNTSVQTASEQHQLANMLKQNSLGLTLVAFFLGGLLLSFTPCVFPMYPILTGIIVGQGDKLTTKKALGLSFAYVQGMAITYTLLGIVVALAGAQFQAMFQHPVILIALSILFIFLALSMFGMFNLALPSSWQNKLSHISNQQKGGSLVGVFTMGALSGLVASPCTTAPLTGALLYISQSGDVVLGSLALYSLSMGMGLPLLILGSSGGKLLPKAGNWMTFIKNIFGLLLLAVPIFLLERFLPEIVTNLLWAALILGSGSYFYSLNQQSLIKNTTKQTQSSFGYLIRNIVIFLWLFFGANLAYQQVFPTMVASNSSSTNEHMFTQVSSLNELNEAVKKANESGKTVMLDLYADWCIACKEFEKYTFSDPVVINSLSNTVLLQIDLTDTATPLNREVMDYYNVLGLPSILFFDLKGQENEQKRVTGFMDAEQFNLHLSSL